MKAKQSKKTVAVALSAAIGMTNAVSPVATVLANDDTSQPDSQIESYQGVDLTNTDVEEKVSASLVVQYVLDGTVIDAKTINGYVNDEISVDSLQLDGYTISSIKDNEHQKEYQLNNIELEYENQTIQVEVSKIQEQVNQSCTVVLEHVVSTNLGSFRDEQTITINQDQLDLSMYAKSIEGLQVDSVDTVSTDEFNNETIYKTISYSIKSGYKAVWKNEPAIMPFSIYVGTFDDIDIVPVGQIPVTVKVQYEDGTLSSLESVMANEENNGYSFTYSLDGKIPAGYSATVSEGYTLEGNTITSTLSSEATSGEVVVTLQANDVTYKVVTRVPNEGYKEVDLDDKASYTETTETASGKYGQMSNVEAAVKPGFSAKAIAQQEIKDGAVVYVEYVRNTYALSFDTNGGSYVKPIKGIYEQTVSLPTTNPTKQGYTFDGWYLDEDCTQEASPTITLDGNKVVYAKWTPAKVNYTVVHMVEKLDANNKSYYVFDSSQTKQANTESSVTGQAIDTRNLKTDEKAYYQVSTTKQPTTETVKADGSTVVYQYYDLKEYTINFNIHSPRRVTDAKITINGKDYADVDGYDYTIKVKLGMDITSIWPSNATVSSTSTNYQFYSWSSDSWSAPFVTKRFNASKEVIPAGSTTINVTGNWVTNASKKSVEYWLEKPDGSGYEKSEEYSESPIYLTGGLNPKELYGYKYDHESNIETGGWFPTVTTYRFYYDRAAFDITYKYGSQNVKTVKDIKFGADISSKNYNYYLVPGTVGVEDDYKFVGWYDNPECQGDPYNFTTMPGNALALYAKFEAPKKTVTLVKNNGEENESFKVTKHETASLPSTLNKEGYIFDGWYEDAACTKEYDVNAPVTEDITLYAKWNANTETSYTVSYIDADGTELADDKVVTGTVGANVNEKAVNINGYIVDQYSKTLTLNPETSKNTIVFTYTKIEDLTYSVQYKYNGTVKESENALEAKASKFTVYPNQDIATRLYKQGYTIKDLYKTVTVSVDGENIVVFDLELADYDITYTGLENITGWDNGSKDNPNPSTYTVETPDITLVNPKKDGYNFKGWELVGVTTAGTHDGMNTVISKGSTGNLTFNATWEEKQIADYFTLDAQDSSKTYDGLVLNPKAASVSLNEGKEGNVDEVKIQYSVDGTNWVSDVKDIAYTDVTEVKVKVKASSQYYLGELNKEVTLTISKAPVKVTTPTKSKVYDGTPLIAEGSITGLVNGETVTFATTGSQTGVGTSDNTYSLTWDGTASQGNYELSENIGKLTVTQQSIDENDKENYLGVKVGELENVVYNGLEQAQKPTVKDKDEKDLAENTDYTVDFSEDVTNVGKVIVTITGKGNYTGTVTRTYEITKAPLKVTTPTSSKVYDGTPLTAEGSITGLVNGETVTFATTGSQTGVGTSDNTYSLTWDGTASQGNYELSENIGKLSVSNQSIDPENPAYKGVTVNDPSDVVYNGKEQKWAPELKDKDTVLTKDVDYVVSYSDDVKNVGIVTVTITGIGNYAGVVTKTYQITPKTVTVVTDSDTKVYDGTPLTAGGNIGGLVDGESVSLKLTGSQTNVGTSKNTYEIDWTKADSKNYTVSDTIGTLTVKPQSITENDPDNLGVTVGTLTDVVYNGLDQAQKPSVINKDGNALVENTDYTVAFSNDIKNVGVVTVTITGTGNYTGTVTRTYNIIKAPLTITTESASKVYDGTALTAGGEIVGLVNNETVTFKVTGTQTNVGTTGNTYVLTWDGTADEDNYSLSTSLGTLTVTEQSIVPENPSYKGVTVNNPTDKVYNGQKQEWYPIVSKEDGSKLVAGKDYTIKFSDDVTNVGKVTVTITGKGNYSGTVTKTYNITPKEVTITTESTSKVYDGTALTAQGSIEGIVEGETYSFTTTGSQTNVGSSVNSYDLQWTGTAKEGNYIVSPSVGTLTVTAQSINQKDDNYLGVTVGTLSDVVYNGLEQAQKPSVQDKSGKDLVEDVDYKVSFSKDVTNVGTVTVTITGIGNYTGVVTRTYNITKAPLTITTESASKVYDGTPLTAEGKVEGLVNGETVSFETTGTITNVGTVDNDYSLTWDGTAKEGNYEVNVDKGTLTVTPQSITENDPDNLGVTVGTLTDVVYNGLEQAQKPSVTDKDGKDLVENTDYTVSFTEDVTNVGEVTVTITGVGNYTGTVVRTYDITPAKLVIKTGSATKEYDGKPLTNSEVAIEGLVNDEILSVTVTGSQTEVGSSENTVELHWAKPLSRVARESTALQSNYDVTFELGTLTVTKAKEVVKNDTNTGVGTNATAYMTSMAVSGAAAVALLKRRNKNKKD
ncbi:InlB B-repeat-containing protein [Floccifex sp.]|uniref:InlB B-repeat-containing protein n=1 Tax=Floccifex sp. TaxID=2815810 RepID=UPI003F0FCCC9